MNVTMRSILCVVLLLIGGSTVRAEEPTLGDLQEEIAELRREVAALRARVAELSGEDTETALEGAAFLVSTREGVVRVTPDGTVKPIKAPNGRPLRGHVSRSGDDVFCRNYRTIHRLNEAGTVMATLKLDEKVEGYAYTALPGRRFAVLDNVGDRIFLVDKTGRATHEVSMGVEPNEHMQSINGLVVENRLLVSEDGNRRILAIDLDTHTIEPFRDFSELRTWIGAMAYADGKYYVCTSTTVNVFTADGPHRRVALVPRGSITSIVIVGGAAFVTVNFTGELLRIDLDSGNVTTVASGLARPDRLVVVRP